MVGGHSPGGVEAGDPCEEQDGYAEGNGEPSPVDEQPGGTGSPAAGESFYSIEDIPVHQQCDGDDDQQKLQITFCVHTFVIPEPLM